MPAFSHLKNRVWNFSALLVSIVVLTSATININDSPAQDMVYGSATATRKSQLSSAQQVMNRLKSANNIPTDLGVGIQVLKSNTLNAATNGQSVVITSALLEKLTSDDEQAFVISHELAHILLNHIGKTTYRRAGLSLVDSYIIKRYVPQNSILQMAGEMGLGLVDKRSSRTYEYQADDLGVSLMKKAGYQPKASLAVFGVLKAAAGPNQTPEFLQDHPITDSRIRALVNKYNLGL